MLSFLYLLQIVDVVVVGTTIKNNTYYQQIDGQWRYFPNLSVSLTVDYDGGAVSATIKTTLSASPLVLYQSPHSMMVFLCHSLVFLGRFVVVLYDSNNNNNISTIICVVYIHRIILGQG